MGSEVLENPARPLQGNDHASTAGIGPSRIYVSPKATLRDVSYPPRPIPGSVADLDTVMYHCDFSTGKASRPTFYGFLICSQFCLARTRLSKGPS